MMALEAAELPDVALRPAQTRVCIGDQVAVELVDADGVAEQMVFDLVADRQADFAAGYLAASAPLARAILGQPVGATVPYVFGDVVAVRILAAARSQRTPSSDLAAARAAATQEAVSKANLEDAVRLALTVNVKWGDYDPEALEAGWAAPPAA